MDHREGLYNISVLRDQVINLPLDLPSLEYINSLLSSSSFTEMGVDPVAIVCEYIQRCLRMVENMCDPFDGIESTNSIRYNDNATGNANFSIANKDGHSSNSILYRDGVLVNSSRRTSSPVSRSPLYNDILEIYHGVKLNIANGYNRDEQIRAIKLLVLFMSSLVRKGLVDPQCIYYEAQEICIRYIWISEVREFRTFLYDEEIDSGKDENF